MQRCSRSHRLGVNEMTDDEATIENETESARIGLFVFFILARASVPLAVGDTGFICAKRKSSEMLDFQGSLSFVEPSDTFLLSIA